MPRSFVGQNPENLTTCRPPILYRWQLWLAGRREEFEEGHELAKCYIRMGHLQAELDQDGSVSHVVPAPLHKKYYEHALRRKAVEFSSKMYSSLNTLCRVYSNQVF